MQSHSGHTPIGAVHFGSSIIVLDALFGITSNIAHLLVLHHSLCVSAITELELPCRSAFESDHYYDNGDCNNGHNQYDHHDDGDNNGHH